MMDKIEMRKFLNIEDKLPFEMVLQITCQAGELSKFSLPTVGYLQSSDK